MDWRPAQQWDSERQCRTEARIGPATGRGLRRLEALAFVLVLAIASVCILQPWPWKSQIHAFGRSYDRYTPCQCEIGWLWRGDTITMSQITRVVTNPTIVHSDDAPDGFFGETTATTEVANPPRMLFLQVGDDAYIPYSLPAAP